jgi:hypothetical protein
MTVENATDEISLPRLENLTRVMIINITINPTSATLDVDMHYPYAIPSTYIVPFMLVNGILNAIVPFYVNQSSCPVSFDMRSDPIVEIFERINATTIQPHPPSLRSKTAQRRAQLQRRHRISRNCTQV